MNKEQILKEKPLYTKWPGETGQYMCILKFYDRKKKEVIIEERPIWLFKNEAFPVHVKYVGELVPNTTKDKWTPCQEWSDEACIGLLGAVAGTSIEDYKAACKYVSDYPKHNKRLHFRVDGTKPIPGQINDAVSGIDFISGTGVEVEMHKRLNQAGMDYNIENISKDWDKAIKKERHKKEYTEHLAQLNEAYERFHMEAR